MEYVVREVRDEDLRQCSEMRVTYLDEEPSSDFLDRARAYRGLYLCAVHDGDIPGIAYPSRWRGELYLTGICVDLNRRGIGSVPAKPSSSS